VQLPISSRRLQQEGAENATSHTGESKQVEGELIGSGLIVPLLVAIGRAFGGLKAITICLGVVWKLGRAQDAKQDQRRIFFIWVWRRARRNAGSDEKASKRQTSHIPSEVIVHHHDCLIVVQAEEVADLPLTAYPVGKPSPCPFGYSASVAGRLGF
jgi:hypothetical protein